MGNDTLTKKNLTKFDRLLNKVKKYYFYYFFLIEK